MTPPSSASVLTLSDEPASTALGERLADLIAAGFVAAPDASNGFTIHFSGDLGAGKTTIVRALLRRLGVEGRIKSPTYTLVEPYVVTLQKSIARQCMNLYCYHFDFFRFEDSHEWLDAGFRDYFSDAALRLVEWPERAMVDGNSLLPSADLHVTLSGDGDGRVAHIDTPTPRGVAWLSADPNGRSLAAVSRAGDS